MSWVGLDRDWLGLAWLGLDWIGSECGDVIGPGWTGLDRDTLRPTRLAHLFPDEDVILVLRVLRGVVLLRPRFFLRYLNADVRED